MGTSIWRNEERVWESIDPGRRITGFESDKERTVDSIPFVQGPPSKISGILPSNSARTAEASVGLILPKRFALGAARG
jgi:hypothetical protein